MKKIIYFSIEFFFLTMRTEKAERDIRGHCISLITDSIDRNGSFGRRQLNGITVADLKMTQIQCHVRYTQ